VKVLPSLLGGIEDESFFLRLEAVLGDSNLIMTDGQADEGEITRTVGHSATRNLRVYIGLSHFNADNNCARWIRYEPRKRRHACL
jgi:hypothetical protein